MSEDDREPERPELPVGEGEVRTVEIEDIGAEGDGLLGWNGAA